MCVCLHVYMCTSRLVLEVIKIWRPSQTQTIEFTSPDFDLNSVQQPGGLLFPPAARWFCSQTSRPHPGFAACRAAQERHAAGCGWESVSSGCWGWQMRLEGGWWSCCQQWSCPASSSPQFLEVCLNKKKGENEDNFVAVVLSESDTNCSSIVHCYGPQSINPANLYIVIYITFITCTMLQTKK